MGRRREKASIKKRWLTSFVAILIIVVAAYFVGVSTQRTLSGTNNEQENGKMETASLVRVVDGDTIVVSLDGAQQKVRLIGINAPESVANDESRNTEEGVEASKFLKGQLSAGQTLYLEKDVSETDQYDRLLRYVWIDVPTNTNSESEIEEKMLEGIIVSAGYAQARSYEPDTAHDKALKKIMNKAISAGRGVSYLWKS